MLNGKQADLVVTDPPYGINVTGGTKDALKIANDDLTGNALQDFLEKAFANLERALKPGGVFYIYFVDGSNGTATAPYNALSKVGLDPQSTLVWMKNMATFSAGRLDYSRRHEPCLYGWKRGAVHYFAKLGEYCTTLAQDDTIDTSKMTKEQLKEVVDTYIAEFTDVINEKKPSRNALHPTMKPLNLIKRHI